MACTTPILRITDGTIYVDLMPQGNSEFGYRLRDWNAGRSQYKDGGITRSSPLASGRVLVDRRLDNVIETFGISIKGSSVDAAIRAQQNLDRLIEKAADYSSSEWADGPVWIEARAMGETNTRYAFVHQARTENYGNPYREPFRQKDGTSVLQYPLIAERGHWQNVVPGTDTCIPVNNLSDQTYGDWALNSTTPTGNVLALFQTTSGRILAGTDDTGKIYKSDDDGDTWSLLYTLGVDPADAVWAFAQNPSTGRIGAACSFADGKFYYSDNDGANWTNPLSGVQFYDIHFEGNVWLMAGRDTATNQGYIRLSATDLVTFYGSSFDVAQIITSAAVSADNYIILISNTNKWYKSTLSFPASGPFTHTITSVDTPRSLLVIASGRILVGADNGYVYKSDDNFLTYSVTDISVAAGDIYSIYQLADGRILAGGDGFIYVSNFGIGYNWVEMTSLPSGQVYSFLEIPGDRVLAGEVGQTLELPLVTYTLGREDTCDNEVYLANHQNQAATLIIKVYDDSLGTYTTYNPDAALPMDLFPSTLSQNDKIYFGTDPIAGHTGPFSSLVFDITSPLDTVIAQSWQFRDSFGWQSLTVVDHTDAIGPWTIPGVASVHWMLPATWIEDTVDGVTTYWIRVNIDSVVNISPPQQGNRFVYPITSSFVEILAANVGGDIPARLRFKLFQQSDKDGPGGSAPDLYVNRVLCGLRSYDRGPLFQAYLNASDEQNPIGIAVSAGTDTTFEPDTRTPTGRRMTYAPLSTGSWVTIATWTLDSTIAQDFYGKFHCFLRGRQDLGSAGDIQLRLIASTGSGGVSVTGSPVAFENTNDDQLLDFSLIAMPTTSLLKGSELGDSSALIVQAYASSLTPQVDLYDLVLIPVDEWAGDFTDRENSLYSTLQSNRYLEIDSAIFFKRDVRSQIKTIGDLLTSIYQNITNGPAILQANAKQRLWFLTARTATIGSSDWRSEPESSYSVQVYKVQQYLGMRGDR